MITNFEEHTSELTAEELALLPAIVEGFKRYTKENPIHSAEIVRRFNANAKTTYKLSDTRLRKFSSHIRYNGILPLIATSKGYYVSNDKEEVRKLIESLVQRGVRIINSTKGLYKFL